MRSALPALLVVASLVPVRARASDAALPSLAPLVDSVKSAVVNVDVNGSELSLSEVTVYEYVVAGLSPVISAW